MSNAELHKLSIKDALQRGVQRMPRLETFSRTDPYDMLAHYAHAIISGLEADDWQIVGFSGKTRHVSDGQIFEELASFFEMIEKLGRRMDFSAALLSRGVAVRQPLPNIPGITPTLEAYVYGEFLESLGAGTAVYNPDAPPLHRWATTQTPRSRYLLRQQLFRARPRT